MLHAPRQFHCTSDTVFDTFPRAQFEVVQASAPPGSGGVPLPVKLSTGKPGENARSTRSRDGCATKNPRRGGGCPRAARVASRNHAAQRLVVACGLQIARTVR